MVGAIVGARVGGVVFPIVGRQAVSALPVEGNAVDKGDSGGRNGSRIIGNEIVGAVTIGGNSRRCRTHVDGEIDGRSPEAVSGGKNYKEKGDLFDGFVPGNGEVEIILSYK
jgi:hypothetical protein